MPLVVIAPLVGIAIVPVTLPVGAGLTPSDGISVASIGIPAAPTDPPGLIPSGEVAPSEGIAVSGSSTSIWANAGLAKSNGQAVATIKNGLIEVFPDTEWKRVTAFDGIRAGDTTKMVFAAWELH